jgi:protein farnesyltransferase/geranylgeranyltransferase type-1 subunit alpha
MNLEDQYCGNSSILVISLLPLYKVWQHRRNIVESLQDASDELSFTQNILKRDSKNYHAWQYRQWVIKKFNLWSNEFDYIEQLLDQDVRNNSAWNQRFFCLSNKLSQVEEVQAILCAEIDYTLVKIALCIDNESSWNYLRALVSRHVELNKSGGDYPRNVLDFCTNKMATLADDERSPFLISFIIDYNYLQCKKMMPDVEKRVECASLVNQSIGLLDSLASKYDTIRVNYWNYLASKWREEFSHIIS